eukprot:TRINITY_DN3510_c1_g1_i1.p1 TRINITY_DN3510_c1_g1~~TRINITY_DN3510_c1_g1_i1.p1  ORF type:complete len:177 (-),score=42.86 TRINITY_DN3510_c1_g1_i1:46-576(-)
MPPRPRGPPKGIPRVAVAQEDEEEKVDFSSNSQILYAWICIIGVFCWLVAIFGLETNFLITTLVILAGCAIPAVLIYRGEMEKANEVERSAEKAKEPEQEVELKEMEARLGKCHIDTLPLLEELRKMYFEKGDFRKALSFCNKGLECVEGKYGKTSPQAKEWLAKKTESDKLYRMM